jgi:4-hydroxy-tetrahydrodipicolinate reductase
VFLLEEMLQARTSTGLSVAELARSLGFDLALWEAHHTRKLDAPSGTAKTLAEAAKIPENRISATRVGNVVGEHVVFLAAESEELRIQHLAHTRKLFALGACDMIERISHLTLSPGLYDRRAFFSLPEKVK